MIKIVSEGDPTTIEALKKEREAEMAERRLSNAAKALAVSVARVASGKDGEIVLAAAALVEAYVDVREKCRRDPDAVLNEAVLDRDWRKGHPGYSQGTAEDIKRWEADGTLRLARAEEAVIHAALALCAAQWKAQPTPESKARSKFDDALDRWEDARKRYWEGRS